MTPAANYHETNPYDGRKRLVAIGFAMLGSAVAWALHLSIMYFLVQPVCRLGGNWTFHTTSLVLLAVSLLAGWTAWRIRGNEPKANALMAEMEGQGGVLPFLSLFGIAASAVFSLAIIVQWIPVFVIGPCT